MYVFFRVGLLAYANDVQRQFNLNAYQNRLDILNNMDVRYTGGTTNTAAAIRWEEIYFIIFFL